MRTIKILFLAIQIFTFAGITANAQMGAETRKDDNIKGPVRLYKKVVLKNFEEKFGEYQASSKVIKQWSAYNKQGVKLFHQAPVRYSKKEYSRKTYFYQNNKLTASAFNFVDINGNNTIGKEKKYSFRYYKYPNSKTMVEYGYNAFGKERVDYTKKYNAQNMLIEETSNLGETYGYKLSKKYDSNSKVIDETKYDGLGKITSKKTWKRDEKGNTTEFIQYNTDGSINSKCINTYNKAGKITEKTWYNANGEIDWGLENKYINDTLLREYLYYKSAAKTLQIQTVSEYDKNNCLIKKTWKNSEANGYFLYKYNENKQKIEELNYKEQKLARKTTYSNYIGKQQLNEKQEYYNANGSLSSIFEYKYDKYGNCIAYENSKFETKFGEQVKIPIIKHETSISYYDENTKPSVNMSIVLRKNAKKKKEKYLKIEIKNAGAKNPRTYFFAKEGVTGKKVNKYESRISTYQLSMQKRFYNPYFIVETENEVILEKFPTE